MCILEKFCRDIFCFPRFDWSIFVTQLVAKHMKEIIKSNDFQNAEKGESFLDDFETLVREIDIFALVLQNHQKTIRTGAHWGNFLIQKLFHKSTYDVN
jgi:hypothetical protein